MTCILRIYRLYKGLLCGKFPQMRKMSFFTQNALVNTLHLQDVINRDKYINMRHTDQYAVKLIESIKN